jgi:hypothetical protein
MMVLLTLLLPIWTFAQSPSELTFTSRFDKFQLQRSGKSYLLEGKPVDLTSFSQFLGLFSKEIEGECSSPGRPDLTVIAKFGETLKTRKFYVESQIVSDGQQCSTVNGDGINFIPLHRSWLLEKTTLGIALQSPFKIMRGDETLAWLEKAGGEWRNGLQEVFPNWEFFASFADSLRDFNVTHRFHKAAAKGKPGFTLVSGSKRYKFSKITATIWAAEIPGTPWLVASSRWSAWQDMEKSQWVDRFSPQLNALLDKSKDLESRRGTLAALEGQWSPSIRRVLAQILFDADENATLKTDTVRLFKQKPSNETVLILIKALGANKDNELLLAISRALRVRNPNGPTIDADLDDSARAKAIAQWNQWAKKIEPEKTP